MIEELRSYSISNFIPFMDESYLRLFERQFEALWPLHLVMFLLGAGTLVAVWFGKRRVVAACLAAALICSAVTFHLQLYAELTPVGRYFGYAFLIQAALVLIWGFAGKAPSKPQLTIPSIIGIGVALAGLLLLPFLNRAEEWKWSGAEYFGMAPDPTTCFLLGVLVVSARPLWFLLLLPIPLLWCAVSGATIKALELPFPFVMSAIAGIVFFAAIWKAIRRVIEWRGTRQDRP